MPTDITSNNYFEIVKNNKATFLKDNEFMRMMRNLQNNLYNISELGFLEDCKNATINSINVSDDENLILNVNNIQDFTKNKDIIEIVKYLDSHAICIVVEPNKNMYFDINYAFLYKELRKYISEDARYSLTLHMKVQKFAIVNKNSELSKEAYRFKDEVFKDCDFQKNEIIFNHCCEALHSVGLSITIYK